MSKIYTGLVGVLLLFLIAGCAHKQDERPDVYSAPNGVDTDLGPVNPAN